MVLYLIIIIIILLYSEIILLKTKLLTIKGLRILIIVKKYFERLITII